jgi:phytanoyl-CoA hydroxylase
MRLSNNEIENYRRDGYIVLKGLIESELLATYDERFLRIVNGDVGLAPAMKIMQDVMVVKGAVEPESAAHAVNKLLCLEEDEILCDFALNPQLVSAVQSLIGDEIYSVASNVFNKPPGVDGRHPMHQDLRYFKIEPASSIVGVWTAMMPATRETGCLAILPKSHNLGLLPHGDLDWEYVNYGFYGINSELDLDKRVHIELDPGDTLLFDPLLVHGSGRNRGDVFRRAISVHYAASDCASTNAANGDWKTNPQTRRIV